MFTGHDVSALDRPEVLKCLFYPRQEPVLSVPPGAADIFITVEEGVRLAARIYPADSAEPHILFFHGNGEIVSDYDNIGPVYNSYGISFLVVDYRGYGQSTGSPTASNLVSDSHTIFRDVSAWLKEHKRTGQLIIMGRSLGSVPALESQDHTLVKSPWGSNSNPWNFRGRRFYQLWQNKRHRQANSYYPRPE